MSWDSRFITSAGKPSGWKASEEELFKWGVVCDLGLEDTAKSSYYCKGSCQNPVPPLKTLEFGDLDECPTQWDDRDWNAEWMSLVEKPLLTPQDVVSANKELESLRTAFIYRHMRTCQILVQERTWSFSYKSLKPLTQTPFYEVYVANNAVFKLQVDTGNRFGPSGNKFTSCLLNNELKAFSHAQTYSNTEINTPLAVIIDLWGVRIMICSRIPGAPILSKPTEVSDSHDKHRSKSGRAASKDTQQKSMSGQISANKWKVGKSIARLHLQPKKPTNITPTELIQLSSAQDHIDIILRIRFKMWKAVVSSIVFKRWQKQRNIDLKMHQILERLGPSLGVEGLTYNLSLTNGSDTRVYLSSASYLLPPVAPLPAINQYLMTCVNTNKPQDTKLRVENLDHIDLSVFTIGQILPAKSSEPETLVQVPWTTTENPNTLIDFVEERLGKAHESGGFVETRHGSLMFWRGSSDSLPNKRASSYAQRVIHGNALLLPQYAAINLLQRWRPEAYVWMKTHTNQMVGGDKPLNPNCFRYEYSHDRRKDSSSLNECTYVQNRNAVVRTLKFMQNSIVSLLNEIEVTLNMRSQMPLDEDANNKASIILPVDLTSLFHKHGLNMRMLGLVRSVAKQITQSSKLHQKMMSILLEEGIARVMRRRIAKAVNSISPFVDDRTAEDSTKHIARCNTGSSEEEEIFSWINGHIRRVATDEFNLMLGHCDSGTRSRSFYLELKTDLMLNYPSILSANELDMACKLLIDTHVLEGPTEGRIRCFKRAQELTGVRYFRHLSGHKPLKAHYIEEINCLTKFPTHRFVLTKSKEDMASTLKRLQSSQERVKSHLGATHPLHLELLTSTANIHALSASGFGRAEQLLTEVSNLAKLGQGSSSGAYVASLIQQSQFLVRVGKFQAAIPCLERARVALDNVIGTQLATVLELLGYCYSILGNISKSLTLVKEAKDIVDDVFGYGKPEIISSYLLASKLLVQTDDAASAKDLVARARDTCEACLGIHPDHAKALYSRAFLSMTKGRYSKAIPYLDAAAEMYTSTLGGDSLEMGYLSMLRARVELLRNRFKSAAKALLVAEDIIIYRTGKDCIQYAEVLLLWSKQNRLVGNHSKGKRYLEESRSLIRDKLMSGMTIDQHCDKCPPLMCELLILSAQFHLSFGRLDKAERELIIAQESTYSSFKDTSILGDVLVQLSRLKYLLGQASNSAKLLNYALSCYSKLNGDRDPRVAIAKIELGHALTALSRFSEAGKYIDSGTKCLEAVCGPQHNLTSRALVVKGFLMISIREDLTAQRCLRKAVCNLRIVHGVDHVYVCNAEVLLAKCLTNVCEFTEALKLLEHADYGMIEFTKHDQFEHLPGSQPQAEANLFYCKVIIGFIEHYLERAFYVEAESLLRRVLPLVKLLSGKDGPLTQQVLFLFGILYGTLAKWQDGHDSLEQASVLARNLYGEDSPLVFRAGLIDARLYLEQAEYNEVYDLLDKLAMFEPLHSPIDAAELRQLRGDLQLALGRHKIAKDFYCSALNILNAQYCARQPGSGVVASRQVEPHLLCAWAAQKLGNCLLHWERWSEAETILAKARDVFALFDSDRKHPKLGDILWRHAFASMKMGINTSEIVLSGGSTLKAYSLEMFVDIDGEHRARTLTYRMCDHTENDITRDEFTLAKDILDESLGPHHPRFGRLCYALAEFHHCSGLNLWSVRLCEQACANARASFGRITPMTASFLTVLAVAQGSIGKWESALDAITDAAWIWEKVASKYSHDSNCGSYLARHPSRYLCLVTRCKVRFAIFGIADVKTRAELESTLNNMKRNNLHWLKCFEDGLRMRDENSRASKLVKTFPESIENTRMKAPRAVPY